MAAIKIETFKGAQPKLAPHLLPVGTAQVAQNCLFRRGSMEPLAGLSAGFSASASIKTLRKYAGNGFDWLGWTGDVSAVPSVVPGDTSKRLFWTQSLGGPRQSSYELLGAGTGCVTAHDLDAAPNLVRDIRLPTATWDVWNTSIVAPDTVAFASGSAGVSRTEPDSANISSGGGRTIRLCVELRGTAGDSLALVLAVYNGSYVERDSVDVVLTGEWKRYYLYATTAPGDSIAILRLRPNGEAVAFRARNPDLRDITSAYPLSYPLGVPAPEDPPTVTLNGSPPADEAVTRTYAYCWEYNGALGGLSPTFSGTLTAGTPNATMYIEGLATEPSGATADKKVVWGGKKINVSQTKKWLFQYDAATSQYVLLAKLDPGDPDYLDDGRTFKRPDNGQPIHKKATGFNASLMPAPWTGSASSNAQASGATVTRYYVFAFVYQLKNVWYRTVASSAGSVSGILDGDTVVLTGMGLALATDIPAGATDVKRAIFRRDGAGAGSEKLVALIPKSQTEYTDSKRNAKLGKLITSYTLASGSGWAAPTCAKLGTTTENYDTETRYYVWTYVTAWGEEGPPSPASAAVEVPPWLWPVVTVKEVPEGYPNITKARLYRTNLNGDFQFVAELTGSLSAGVSYTDHVSASALGASALLSTAEYDPPPDDLHSLVALPGGVLAGLAGRVLCFSEPGLPYAWPVKYRQSMDFDGVALGVGSGGLWVWTTGTPYLCQGADPAQMTLYKIDQQHACVSATSMVDMGEFLIYATPDGLAAAAGGEVKLLTGEALTRDQWQAYSPADIRAYLHEGRYVAFNGSAGFIFDPQAPTVTDITGIVAGAGYTDPGADVLYLRAGSAVAQWRGGAGMLVGLWRSGKFVSDVPITPTAARVDAEGYPVTFKLYADGVLKHTQSVASGLPFRLPAGYRGRAFEVEVAGIVEVRRVVVGESMEEVAG